MPLELKRCVWAHKSGVIRRYLKGLGNEEKNGSVLGTILYLDDYSSEHRSAFHTSEGSKIDLLAVAIRI